MLIVDSQIHIWENGKMSAHHRQIPTYSVDDALAEMASAGVDAAVIHPPSSLGENVNVLAVEAVKAHPDKFCILGHFDLLAPNGRDIVKNWRQRNPVIAFNHRGRIGGGATGNYLHQMGSFSIAWRNRKSVLWCASEPVSIRHSIDRPSG